MERIVNIKIEKLPEGYYLATSDNLQGLLNQGKKVGLTKKQAQAWMRHEYSLENLVSDREQLNR